ncbi:unnamed protein product [Tilletia controversa]|uniref:Large ribosomal subunit protein mL46 n=3 Tax=Tilletia TaxID=13289 RepID=A0A8X7T0G3_9BASI|nr:hypothetical protein CF336_g735 [Tilletia laevis]KAE8205040.1 hypothetical protein CF328_g723 [Tilletia controversa]KAE8262232.1 hypothetical protein A4X03_0g2615 [Tilletia caries]KAE8208452.1 hypothetical protein CF335_g400 [Tilletia laevis]KAE8255299.1 hypothetical protein A4X06_0g496 [Tilletia controversa]
MYAVRSAASKVTAAAAAGVSSSASASGSALSRRIAPALSVSAARSPWTAASRSMATVSDGAPSSPSQAGAAKGEQMNSEEAQAAVQEEVAAAVVEAAADAVAAASSGEADRNPGGRSNPIYASLVISRPPTLLRQPSELEQAFFAYNTKLRSALAQPFPRDFYFKKGSTAEQRFDDAEARRLSALQKGSTDPLAFITGSSSDASSQGGAGGPAAADKNPDADLYKTLPRTTEADEKNNLQSLNRKLDRTLYLLTRPDASEGKNSPEWTLPTQRVDRSRQQKDNLHQAAQNAVVDQLGENIDVWLVSNLPIGVTKPASSSDRRTYYMQAHVLSGNVSAQSSKNAKDGEEGYAWLTREEIEERLSKSRPGYWEQIRDFLRG